MWLKISVMIVYIFYRLIRESCRELWFGDKGDVVM